MTQTKFDIPALVRRFNEEGYLVLRNVLSEERVARLNRAVDEILGQEPGSLSYSIYNAVERHPEIAALIDEPELLPLVVNILGYNIQFHISHLTVRHPNPDAADIGAMGYINWHQDGTTPLLPTVNGITARYYMKICYLLSDMSEPDRGNTKVIPRSHNRSYVPEHRDALKELPGEVHICGKPGDVFLFPQNLWHSAAPNRSSHTRRQLFIGYSYTWMRPLDYREPSEQLLRGAQPIRLQLLGKHVDNPFNYYTGLKDMPLKALHENVGS